MIVSYNNITSVILCTGIPRTDLSSLGVRAVALRSPKSNSTLSPKDTPGLPSDVFFLSNCSYDLELQYYILYI